MKINDKFKMIEKGVIIDFCMIESISAVQHRTVVKPGLRNYYFESETMCGSPWIIYEREPKCFIGQHSYMNDGGYLKDKVLIGRYCSIGRRVTIGAGMHSMESLSTSPSIRGSNASAYSILEMQKLRFQNKKRHEWTILYHDCWIGDGVVIMPGVKIGIGAIIGANAVVTSDVEPYSIVAGIPAKHLRWRFPKEIVESLIASEWWEYPSKILNTLPTSNVFQLLEKLKELDTQTVFIPTYKSD